VIVTSTALSESNAYLKKLGCQVIELKQEKVSNDKLVDDFQKKKFLVSKSHKEKIFNILENKIQNTNQDFTFFFKTFVACFSPYETIGVITKLEAPLNKIQAVLTRLDFDKYYTIFTL